MGRFHTLSLLLGFSLLLVGSADRAAAAPSPAKMPSVGSTILVQGFAAKLVSVVRAKQAGAADYAPAKGDIFLLVTMSLKRQGGHDTYLAQEADFSIQTSGGGVIDSELFGMQAEWQDKHLYTKALTGVIGFEVPANDKNLQLLWQPELPSNPDAQGAWMIGTAGKTVEDYL